MQQAINRILSLTLCAIWLLIIAQTTLAQTTQFTYQGKLSNSGAPANGNFDLNFKLFDNLTPPGNQLGSVALPNVMVTGGIFTVTLDFGACSPCFNGSAQFLEIEVRSASIGMFTTLSPRQPVTSTPYAVKSLNAATANGLSVACVNCVTSSQIASAPAGSPSSYVQNTTTQQPMADFNISGNGIVGGTLTGSVVNATTQYNIGIFRVLSVAGNANTFVGLGTGQANSSGFQNSFVGGNAGNSNTTGGNNSFFGLASGFSNTMGLENSFVGFTSGFSNTLGNSNSFFGRNAGGSNTTGSSNTIVGSYANVGAENLTNATAIGAFAVVSQSNSLVLGNNVNVGIGASLPVFKLHVVDASNTGLRVQTNAAGGTIASFGGRGEFQIDTLSVVGGRFMIKENGNVGIGTTAPQQRLHVVGDEILSTGTQSGFKFRDRGSTSASDDWVWYSESGVARFFQSGLGDLLTIQTDGNVGIGIPSSRDDKLSVGGTISLFLAEGGETPLCHNGSNQISDCSSSRRYKQNINPFTQGLSLIKQLRPVSFNWKSSNKADLGLVAEQVAEVEPLMVTRNAKGEIEGVKYDRVGVVLVNAVQEQQRQIESQQKKLDEQDQFIKKQKELLQKQQVEMESLKILVCSQNPTAETCKSKK